MTKKTKKKAGKRKVTSKTLPKQDALSDLIDPLLEHLVKFGKDKGVKRTRVRIGEIEAEVEFPTSEEKARAVSIPMLQPHHENIPTPPSNNDTGSIEELEKNPNMKIIRSPLVGTFYRATSPGAKPLVEIGDLVKKGQTLAIIEAMKLFNELESDYEGKVLKILIENENPVEYDQPLFVLTVQ